MINSFRVFYVESDNSTARRGWWGAVSTNTGLGMAAGVMIGGTYTVPIVNWQT